jgi:tRNA-guanine family transglycosylase
MKSALTFEAVAKCSTTKARAALLTLPHGPVNLPVFMPVGTQGTLKGLTPKQVEDQNCQIMLNNTYHLVCGRCLIFTLTRFMLSFVLGGRD